MSSWNNLKNSIFLNKKNIIVFPLLIAFFLYYPFIKHGWWTGDDTAILHATIKHGGLSFFYKPEIWRTISATNLTPWVNLSYAIDWNLFGFNPQGFFIHHLLSFLLTALCCGFLMMEITTTLPAIGVLLLFITSLPALALIEHLWLRHYMEGLAFAALAFFFFLKGISSKSLIKALIGSLFYLLSVTAKEIYVPLIAFIIFYPDSFSRRNNILKMPFLFISLLYIGWRIYMLGFSNIFEADLAVTSSLIPQMRDLPILIAKGLFLQNIFFFCFFIVLAVSFFLFVKKKDGYLLLFFFVCLTSILVPIIPVAGQLKNFTTFDLSRLRILTVITICLYFFILQAFYNLSKKATILLLISGLAINLWNIYGADTLNKGLKMHQNHKTMGQFLLNAGPQKVFVFSYSVPWFFTELLEVSIKTGKKKPDQCPLFCTDACLCQDRLKNRKVEFYTFNGHNMVKTKDWNCNINTKVNISAIFRYNKGLLTWKFGPFEKGQYCALPMENGLPTGIYCLPRRGKIKVYLKKDFQVILRYKDPSGWLAYSDIIEIKVNGDTD